MKKKVCLIYPPINAPVPVKSTLLGVGYLASVLRNKGHEVTIKDLALKKGIVDIDFKEKPDCIGISTMFSQYKSEAFNLSKQIKESFPDIHLILGGAHASTFPEECLEYADTVVVGEGEEVICDVVENRKKGIVYAERIRNLDSLPFPAWDLMKDDMDEINRLSAKQPFLMRHPLAHIITSRGCPNACIFCALKVTWGRFWYARSAENVVDEIEFLYNKGYREIHFNDDNCSINKERMYAICDKIISRKLDIRVACPTGIHIGTLDKPLLKRMKQAGFYRLCFGIETGDQSLQRYIEKNIDLKKAEKVIQDANDLGFWTSATFINDFPFTTRTQTAQNLLYAFNSELDFPIFYHLIIQPKTELDKRMKDIKVTMETENNGQGTIAFFYKKFISWTLTNPYTYIKIIKKIRSWEDFLYTFGLVKFALKNLVFRKSLNNENLRGRK